MLLFTNIKLVSTKSVAIPGCLQRHLEYFLVAYAQDIIFSSFQKLFEMLFKSQVVSVMILKFLIFSMKIILCRTVYNFA